MNGLQMPWYMRDLLSSMRFYYVYYLLHKVHSVIYRFSLLRNFGNVARKITIIFRDFKIANVFALVLKPPQKRKYCRGDIVSSFPKFFPGRKHCRGNMFLKIVSLARLRGKSQKHFFASRKQHLLPQPLGNKQINPSAINTGCARNGEQCFISFAGPIKIANLHNLLTYAIRYTAGQCYKLSLIFL